MGLTFEWDPKKAAQNLKKHGVSFQEASMVFYDPFSKTTLDVEYSTADEQRFVRVGRSNRARTLIVVYVEREDNIRVISARKATRRERKEYGEGR